MPTERILVVDDSPTNLKLLRLILSTAGYEVVGAADAEEALARIAEHSPQLVLMDIQLPGMDGLELTRLLKAAPETKDIIVLAVTAYAMRGDEERAVAAGCDGYLSKPVDTHALPKLVAKHLSSLAARVKTG